MSGWVTAATAARHEALMLHLSRLGRQVEAIAVRRPEAAVSPTLGVLAGAAMFEANRLVGQKRRGQAAAVAADYAGLAAQLGQALAGLEAFEAQHTAWDGARGAPAWRLGPETLAPVLRLKPAMAPPTGGADVPALRAKLAGLIEARLAAAYQRGFADGQRAAGAGEAGAPALPA